MAILSSYEEELNISDITLGGYTEYSINHNLESKPTRLVVYRDVSGTWVSDQEYFFNEGDSVKSIFNNVSNEDTVNIIYVPVRNTGIGNRKIKILVEISG